MAIAASAVLQTRYTGALALHFSIPGGLAVLSKFSSARRSILYFFVDLTGLTTKTTCHPPIFG
jgi:hypothetical protein